VHVDERVGPGLLEALWRYRWSSLAITVVFAVLSAAGGLLLHHQVTAHARLALVTPRADNVIGGDLSSEAGFVRFTKQRALYVTSEPVLSRAATRLGDGTTTDYLRTHVTATAAEDGDMITVTATATTAGRAADLCNKVVRAYQDETLNDVNTATQSALNAINVTRQQVQRSIAAAGAGAPAAAARAAATQTLSQLEVKANDITVETTLYGSDVSFVDPATAAAADQAGLPLKEAVLGLAFGALIAGTAAWLRADRDQRVREPDAAAALLHAPLLGEVPELSREQALTLDSLDAMPAAPYQFVASGLQATMDVGVVLVTSAQRGAGRTTAAAHIAAAAARDGVRVMLIDADARSKRLSSLIGLAHESAGLTALAGRGATLDECTYSVSLTEDVQLWMVPAGDYTDSAPSLFRSTAMSQAVLEMRSKYDLVVIDSAPLPNSPETAALARHADGVLVVVQRGATVRALQRLSQQMSLYAAPIVGCIFSFALGGQSPSRGARPVTPAPTRP
jgi:polysaccharide biosynthesis transport protein